MNQHRLRPRSLVAIALVAAPWTLAVAAPVELVGQGTLSATASDGLTGLTPPLLEDGVTPHDRAGGLGSGIAYTGVRNRYIAQPDRGPADGTTSYQDRTYVLDVAVPAPAPGVVGSIAVSLVQATILRNEAGLPFVGTGNQVASGLRLDPEGIRLGSGGTFFVSDEYGPFVYEFNAAGTRLRTLATPAKFAIANPSVILGAAGTAAELSGNTSGRQANRGMEGLAISPDGKKLFGIMQNALLQDGGLNAAGKRAGTWNRIVEFDIATGAATREFAYAIDTASKGGVNELLAINDHELLVIERDSEVGVKAVTKKIFKIDLAAASDVSGIANLPQTGAIPGATPVAKAPFINLLDPAFNLVGATFPEKIEGLAFGPDLPDGRRLLVVTTDNDFVVTNDTLFWAFAIERTTLPTFAAQTLSPAIDVRPGDPDNHINPRARGAIPVAIFGNAFLPVDAIDRATIKLGGAPVKHLFSHPLCLALDGNGDGLDDLYCLVDGDELALAEGATSITLEAATTTGTRVRASTPITIVGNGGGH